MKYCIWQERHSGLDFDLVDATDRNHIIARLENWGYDEIRCVFLDPSFDDIEIEWTRNMEYAKHKYELVAKNAGWILIDERLRNML